MTKAKNAQQKENLKLKLEKEKSKAVEAEQARLLKERKPWFEVRLWYGKEERAATRRLFLTPLSLLSSSSRLSPPPSSKLS